jgi:hypothetical protein
MKFNKKIWIFSLVLFVGILIPMSEFVSGYNFTESYKQTDFCTDPNYWTWKINYLAVYLDLDSGVIQGIIRFTLRLPFGRFAMSVDKAHLFVDTLDGDAVSWAQTYTNYYIKGGNELTGYIIKTLESGSSMDDIYSITIWLKINQMMDSSFGMPMRSTQYIGQRLVFAKNFDYYPWPEADTLQVFSSVPDDAYI